MIILKISRLIYDLAAQRNKIEVYISKHSAATSDNFQFSFIVFIIFLMNLHLVHGYIVFPWSEQYLFNIEEKRLTWEKKHRTETGTQKGYASRNIKWNKLKGYKRFIKVCWCIKNHENQNMDFTINISKTEYG